MAISMFEKRKTSALVAPPISVIDAARTLAPRIRTCSDVIERERRLPAELVEAMAGAGLFRMCVPQKLGGGEVDVATLIRAIEELSHADGSVGWCAMIGATSGVVSGYLAEDAAGEIYGGAGAISGGALAPKGRAIVTEGGYTVTGRWPFASGCEHCDWLMGSCVVVDHGVPRLLPNGAPDARLMLFRSSDARIIDTWSVAGLCGTGSHDIAVADIFVPEGHSLSLISDPPRQPGPLYAFPVFGLLALGIAGVAIGIARRAIEELVSLASEKTPTGSRRFLAERSPIQVQVAQAEATLRAARALLFETVIETWETALAHGEISVGQRALLRVAATHATTSAAGAVDLMYNAGGGTSIYTTSPLQRCFRDVHTLTQHMMVAPATYELTGRLFLGLETDVSML